MEISSSKCPKWGCWSSSRIVVIASQCPNRMIRLSTDVVLSTRFGSTLYVKTILFCMYTYRHLHHGRSQEGFRAQTPKPKFFLKYNWMVLNVSYIWNFKICWSKTIFIP
jgi:hypothetical protein